MIARDDQKQSEIEFEITSSLLEWDYGEYEGRTADGIRELRSEQGMEYTQEWNIWRDGCPGGEYAYITCLFSELS